ncbi:MAG TPA: chromate efflux transporter [Candidatus Polarisedimenticolaceae bacterium]|nr:chromate efflux transporter [Candidatus Polarisedimenticolaceae bacterium]
MERPSADRVAGSEGVRFADALRFWLKLGFISFGGPAGQIAIMHREIVERRRWICETRFLHALNYCILLPGPEAQQLATYVGWLLHGTRGALAAGILFVLPSVFILLALSVAYAAYGEIPAAAGLLAGCKAVVVAIVAEAALRLGRRALRGWVHLLVAGCAFVGIYFLHVPFPVIVLAAATVGLSGARWWPATWTPPGAPPSGAATDATDDGEPIALPRSAPSAVRALRTLAVGILLWLLPLAVLAGWLGRESIFVKQYQFFTGAAFVTFGGAYAVLAYVSQAAVDAYGWITPAAAVDGLALAETTPGPLIMVLQFIGFMTGWNHPDPLDPLTAGTLGALVTTWTTFLPCFLFVLIGAPWIEALRGNRPLHGALSGVTASVIGVIANLALVFGAAVILPDGPGGGVEWFAAGLSALAFLAIYRYRIDALWIVLAGGAAGLVRTWF